MTFKVQNFKSAPFLKNVTHGNEIGIIATGGMFCIILAENILKFGQNRVFRQEKQNFFVNFFTKTCTEFLNGVKPIPSFDVTVSCSLRNFS